MNLTNKFGYPEAIWRAINNDTYSKGTADFSCTELLQPSRIYALKIKHKDEIEEDVSDRIWSLLGQSVHAILERANGKDHAEVRYFAKFGEHTVSAQIDTLDLDNFILSDYKCVTAWKFMGGKAPPPEYSAQLNIQLEILRRNNMDARALRIIGILRDWNMRESHANPFYPQSQIATMDIPMWSREETTAFVNERIASHIASLNILPICTPDERWASPNKFAIMKGTNRRAIKLVDSMPEALDYLENMGPGHRIENRPGESRRCSSYCNVNKFCTWYQQQIKGDRE